MERADRKAEEKEEEGITKRASHTTQRDLAKVGRLPKGKERVTKVHVGHAA